MALPLVVDGVTFSYPEPGDRGLAQNATDWANAITTAVASGESFFADAGFHAHITVAQTGISAATTVVFDSEDYDDRSGYNPATGIYTVPATYGGDWVFSVSVLNTQVTSAGNQTLTILKNGAAIAGGILPSVPTGTANAAPTATCIVGGLVAGDQIKCQLTASAGTISTVANVASQFSRTAPSLDPRVEDTPWQTTNARSPAHTSSSRWISPRSQERLTISSTLKGPVSEQLRAREGKRLSKGLDLRQEEGNNPTIPNKSDEGEPGTSSGPFPASRRPHALREEAAGLAGKPIEGLTKEATERATTPRKSARSSRWRLRVPLPS